MATQAQIDANRRNARQSTGPRTPQGKSAAAGNAVTHGMFCRDLVLRGESADDLESLRAGICRRLRPGDALERLYAERVVVAAWKLKRLLEAERRMTEQYLSEYQWVNSAAHLYSDLTAAAELHRLQKHAAALERAMDKARLELGKLREEREEEAEDEAEMLAGEGDCAERGRVDPPSESPPEPEEDEGDRREGAAAGGAMDEVECGSEAAAAVVRPRERNGENEPNSPEPVVAGEENHQNEANRPAAPGSREEDAARSGTAATRAIAARGGVMSVRSHAIERARDGRVIGKVPDVLR